MTTMNNDTSKNVTTKANKKKDKADKDKSKLPPNPSCEQIYAYFEDKLNAQEISFNAKIETLQRDLEQKDVVIKKLNVEISELKKSCSFLSNETSEIKNKMQESHDEITTKMENANTAVKEIINKSTDLEDRSRRSNLVFL